MAAARGGADGQPGNPGYGVSRGEGDFTARDYLKAAEDAFAFLEKNNLLFANDGKENILDDYLRPDRGDGALSDDEEGRLQGSGGPAGGIARGQAGVVDG